MKTNISSYMTYAHTPQAVGELLRSVDKDDLVTLGPPHNSHSWRGAFRRSR